MANFLEVRWRERHNRTDSVPSRTFQGEEIEDRPHFIQNHSSVARIPVDRGMFREKVRYLSQKLYECEDSLVSQFFSPVGTKFQTAPVSEGLNARKHVAGTKRAWRQ